MQVPLVMMPIMKQTIKSILRVLVNECPPLRSIYRVHRWLMVLSRSEFEIEYEFNEDREAYIGIALLDSRRSGHAYDAGSQTDNLGMVIRSVGTGLCVLKCRLISSTMVSSRFMPLCDLLKNPAMIRK